MPLSAPTLVQPANNALGVYASYNLLFQWNGVAGAVSYVLQIATDSNFTSFTYNQNVGNNTNPFIGSGIFAANTTYYWRVAGVDSGGLQGDWSIVWSFTYALPITNISSPTNGHVLQPTNLTVTWYAVTGADYYELQVATDVSFTSIVADINYIAGSSQVVVSLNFNTKYYVRVKGVANGGNYSPWSSVILTYAITTAPSPLAPGTPIPGDAAILAHLNFTLSWDNPLNMGIPQYTDSYDFMLATDSMFANIVLTQSGVKANSYWLSGLAPNTTYYWHVRSNTVAGISAWSPTWSFTTGAAGDSLPDIVPVMRVLAPLNSKVMPLIDGYNAGLFHGVVHIGNKLYATSRGQSIGGVPPSPFVAISDDLSVISGYILKDSSNNNDGNYDSMVTDGTNLFTISNSSGTRHRIDPTTLANTVVGVRSISDVIATDGANVFAGIFNHGVDKYSADFSTYIMSLDATKYRTTADIAHSMVVDDTYVYVISQAPQTSGNPHGELLKINKTDMSFQGMLSRIPGTSDDITQDANYIYMSNESYAGDGLVIGGLAIRKADLAVFSLPKYGTSDTPGTASYGQMSWGAFLADMKTNKHLYLIDHSNPAMWAPNLPVSKFLMADYDYSAQPFGIVNETAVTNDGRVIGLTWENPAYVVLFDLSEFWLGPPAVPVLSTPSDSTVDTGLSVSIGWGAANHADSYRLQVSTASNFSTTVLDVSGLTGTGYNLTGLTHGTQYYWRVLAHNANGDSAWSSAWSFTTVALPQVAPTLVSPGNNSTGISANPTLSWTDPEPDISLYELEIATDSGFTQNLQDITSISSTSYQSNLVYSTTYYWRVRAVNANGNGPWSNAWSFTTVTGVTIPKIAPTLDDPGNDTTILTLYWSDSEQGIDSYELQLAMDPGFAQIVRDVSTIIERSYQLTVQPGKYYWRVRGVNSVGDGPWSSVQNFSIGIMPGSAIGDCRVELALESTVRYIDIGCTGEITLTLLRSRDRWSGAWTVIQPQIKVGVDQVILPINLAPGATRIELYPDVSCIGIAVEFIGIENLGQVTLLNSAGNILSLK